MASHGTSSATTRRREGARGGALHHPSHRADVLPSLFEGGAYGDGSFDVGGYATQLGGALEITACSSRTIDGAGQLSATIESRSWGSFEGHSADGHGVREVTGVRRD